MKQQKIKKIIKEMLDELSGLCEKISPDFDKETVHDFRVAVKTLRSFLRLLRMNNANEHLELPKKFNRLYHIAGAIRDGQLELEKLTGNNLTLPVYFDNLSQIISRQKKEWQRHYNKKVLQKFSAMLDGIQYETLPSEALSDFVNLKMISIIKLSSIKSATDNQVHSIRKSVKDILYTAKITKRKWKTGYDEIRDLSTDELEQIAGVIGEYNDGRVMRDHLKSFHSKKMEAEERTTIETLCTEEAKRLKSAKKTALAIVKTFTKINL